jgi:membrane protein DedA with SNARE-associated domain
MTPDIQWFVQTFGYLAAALAILIETLGIPFPGETVLLVVSAYAAQGHLDIRLVIVTATLGTIVGADVGYAIGRRGGRPFLERFSRTMRIRQGYLARTEMFFGRFGGATILFARFVAGLRQWSSVLAGVARMPLWRFQIFTVVGSVVWATVVCLAGFYLGRNLALLERVFRDLGYLGIGVVAVVVLVIWLLHRRATRSGR